MVAEGVKFILRRKGFPRISAIECTQMTADNARRLISGMICANLRTQLRRSAGTAFMLIPIQSHTYKP